MIQHEAVRGIPVESRVGCLGARSQGREDRWHVGSHIRIIIDCSIIDSVDYGEIYENRYQCVVFCYWYGGQRNEYCIVELVKVGQKCSFWFWSTGAIY